LINNKNDLKLIDFSLGKMFTKGQLLKTQCGSPFYASPEMINGNKYNGVNSDIWSLGLFYI
jgi:non-specific serine/threonine protein kinase